MNLLNFPILLFLPKKTVIGPLKKFKFLITAWLESLTLSTLKKLKCPILEYLSNVVWDKKRVKLEL